MKKFNGWRQFTEFVFGMFLINLLYDVAGPPKAWWSWGIVFAVAIIGNALGRWIWEKGQTAKSEAEAFNEAFQGLPEAKQAEVVARSTQLAAQAMADNARIAAQRDELRGAALRLSLKALDASKQHWAYCRVYREGRDGDCVECDCGHRALVDEAAALNKLVDSQKG